MIKEEFINMWLNNRAELILNSKLGVNWEGLAVRAYEEWLKLNDKKGG